MDGFPDLISINWIFPFVVISVALGWIFRHFSFDKDLRVEQSARNKRVKAAIKAADKRGDRSADP